MLWSMVVDRISLHDESCGVRDFNKCPSQRVHKQLSDLHPKETVLSIIAPVNIRSGWAPSPRA